MCTYAVSAGNAEPVLLAALAGGAYLAKHIRNKQRPMTTEEWANSPQSARNNPKLSPEEAQRIADEAIFSPEWISSCSWAGSWSSSAHCTTRSPSTRPLSAEISPQEPVGNLKENVPGNLYSLCQ